MPKLVDVGEGHSNLLVLDKSVYSDKNIEGVYLNCVVGHGKIMGHKHPDSTELLLVYPNSYHAGVDYDNIIRANFLKVIRPGINHGYNGENSYGEWISIHVKNKSVNYKDIEVLPRQLRYSGKVTFSTEKGDLMIGFSRKVEDLEKIIQDPQKVIALPPIDRNEEGKGYNGAIVTDNYKGLDNSIKRYIAISKII